MMATTTTTTTTDVDIGYYTGSSPPIRDSSLSTIKFKQRSRGSTSEDSDLSTIIQLEMLPQHVMPTDMYYDLPQLVAAANHGIQNGVKPILADGAMGGTYFFRDEKKNITLVCKPGDEEPNSPHNPHQTSGVTNIWGGCYKGKIVPGFGMYREVAAFVLDHGFAGVPPTQLARVCDRVIQTNNRSNSLTDNSSSNSNSNIVSSSPTTTTAATALLRNSMNNNKSQDYKLCSVQGYVRHQCSAEDMGPGRFALEDIHRIAAFDIRLCNLDRHEGNILVCQHNPYRQQQEQLEQEQERQRRKNSGDMMDVDETLSQQQQQQQTNGNTRNNNNNNGENEPLHLVPIDHGYILPHVLYLGDPSLSWMNWPQSNQPICSSVLEHIQQLDTNKDIDLLHRIIGEALPASSLLTFQLCTSYLKKAATAGLTLHEIGTGMVADNYAFFPVDTTTTTTATTSLSAKSGIVSQPGNKTSTTTASSSSLASGVSLLQRSIFIAVHRVASRLRLHRNSLSNNSLNSGHNNGNSNSSNNAVVSALSSSPKGGGDDSFLFRQQRHFAIAESPKSITTAATTTATNSTTNSTTTSEKHDFSRSMSINSNINNYNNNNNNNNGDDLRWDDYFKNHFLGRAPHPGFLRQSPIQTATTTEQQQQQQQLHSSFPLVKVLSVDELPLNGNHFSTNIIFHSTGNNNNNNNNNSVLPQLNGFGHNGVGSLMVPTTTTTQQQQQRSSPMSTLSDSSPKVLSHSNSLNKHGNNNSNNNNMETDNSIRHSTIIATEDMLRSAVELDDGASLLRELDRVLDQLVSELLSFRNNNNNNNNLY